MRAFNIDIKTGNRIEKLKLPSLGIVATVERNFESIFSMFFNNVLHEACRVDLSYGVMSSECLFSKQSRDSSSFKNASKLPCLFLKKPSA